MFYAFRPIRRYDYGIAGGGEDTENKEARMERFGTQNRNELPRANGPYGIPRRDFIRLGALAIATWTAPKKARAEGLHQPKEISMDITRIGSTPSQPGPADWFTGSTRVDFLFQAKDPSAVSGASVTFEPGARTVWHTHPVGQHLIITAGLGWVQEEGGPIQEVRPGDVVWFPPAVKHWHGASPTNAMTHIAIQEARNGSPVEWLEPVSEDQYRK